MGRLWKGLAWIIGLLAILPALAVGGLLIGADVAPGQRAIERLVAAATDGEVVITGLSGRFPRALHADRVELIDQGSAWLTITNLRAEWSPLDLAERTVRVDHLTAGGVVVQRLPAPSEESSSNELPVRVVVGDAAIDRIDLAAPVLGVAAAFSLVGSIDLPALDRGSADLSLRRLDAEGAYRLDGSVDAQRIDAKLSVQEPAHGLVAALTELPEIGPLSVDAAVTGRRGGERTHVAVSAGPLTAAADGTVDLAGQSAELDLTAAAPAMAPRPDVSWRAMSLAAHLSGWLDRPRASGRLTVDQLRAGGAAVAQLVADLQGDGRQVGLAASLTGMTIPGPKPELLAAAPLLVTAKAALADAGRPLAFTLSHPLIAADGQVDTADGIKGKANLSLPLLAPIAQLAGVGADGHAALALSFTHQGDRSEIAASGSVAITRGPAPLPALLGPQAKIDLAGVLEGDRITVDHAQVEGKSLRLGLSGTDTGDRLEFEWSADLADLAALATGVAGKVSARGRLQGLPDDMTATATASGEAAAAGLPRQPFEASLTVRGLPHSPVGQVAAHGMVAGAPLQLAATLRQESGGAIDLSVRRAAWKSAEAHGQITLAPTGGSPRGAIDLHVAQLDDFQPVIGMLLEGSLDGHVEVVTQAGRTVARVTMDGRKMVAGSGRVDHLSVQGTVADPLGGPRVALRLVGDGVAAGAAAGSLTLTATGPTDAVSLQMAADLSGNGGVHVSAAGKVDLVQGQATVESLEAKAQGETLRLLAPAHLTFAQSNVAVDRLRLGVRQAVLEVGGSLSPTLDLHAGGAIELAILDPILNPDGRNLHGRLTLDIDLAGTLEAPRMSGSVRLAGGDLQDYQAGVHLTAITALLDAEGDSWRIREMTARAGPGSLSVTGTCGLLAPGLPVDLTITARDAQPLATDLLTATLGADLTVKGQAVARLDLAGTIHVRRATINIPENFPSSVAVLDVRRPGQPPPSPPPPGTEIGLDLTIQAPEQVFVRGHGLDAEMGGTIRIGGTAEQPDVSGGLALRNGTYSLAGQPLTFSQGTVGFNGSGLRRKIDPTLDFTAQGVSSDVTATLSVTGYADAPKISLSSTPELPQDEVLAELLFGQGMKQLSPLQIAQVAQGLASLAGVGGGFDPLAMVRDRLGLDRLSTGAGTNGSGTSVAAGKYVAKGVYVGAKQQSSGGGTQAQVQVDLTEHLRLDSSVGSGGDTRPVGTSPQNDPGSNVGLTYKFEY
jgi:translocation and assembly module TamB